ncbi:hypothetical protein C7S15_8021 [Burkholderia cepacia]|nr:hypothetical protein [Burkholderia cepacia]
MRPVSAGDVAHRREYPVPGRRERFCSVAAEAAAGAGYQNGFGHVECVPAKQGWGAATESARARPMRSR